MNSGDSKDLASNRNDQTQGPAVGGHGWRLAHFELLRLIGRGGMGEVYLAYDRALGRHVALKLLPEGFARDPGHKRRFETEARAAATLNHPNIVTVYEFGEAEGRHYLATEFVEGETLGLRLRRGPLSASEAMRIAAQVASALEASHSAGIVHRDLKPANIMVRSDGVAKVVDFGLARIVEPDDEGQGSETRTIEGAVLGTAAYMSPEQARGLPLDWRTDMWSLGVVLYEMLSGRPPYEGNTQADLITGILTRKPEPFRPDLHVPASLNRVVLALLEKNPDERRTTAAQLATSLMELSAGAEKRGSAKWKRRLLAPGVLIGLGAIAWLGLRSYNSQWARYEASAQIRQLAEKGDYEAAFQIAARAERWDPRNPALAQLWPEISQALSVVSIPAGATVEWRPYRDLSAAWQAAGRTPVQHLRLAAGPIRLRLTAPGYEPFECAFSPPQTSIRLRPTNQSDGMTTVPATHLDEMVAGLGQVRGDIDEYEIDKYEVTNAAYRKFVDADGYRRSEYWKQPFLKNGRSVSWDEAVREFVDSTGRPGPSSWDAGGYPAGQADFPVGGVSWYEAAAYAEFAQKQLPTVQHWIAAANVRSSSNDEARFLVPQSNFESRGPRPVGASAAVNAFGAYDMGGNVREWCWNASGEQRFALGGFWSDPGYMLERGQAISAWDRSAGNGFRCVRYHNPAVTQSRFGGPIPPPVRVDYRQAKPVSDDVFENYRPLWVYQRKPPHATVDSVDDASDLWRRERVRLQAPYGKEEIIAYLFLPKQGRQPYQCVIYLGGNDILRPGTAVDVRPQSYILRSGRAMLCPIFKGALERFAPSPIMAVEQRDRLILWRKDLGASLDYLETRKDIDSTKLAYMGASMGANFSPMLIFSEDRIKTVVWYSAGLRPVGWLPECDPVNFLPRVRIPALVVTGLYDSIYPTDTAQEPIVKLLGTSRADKKHVLVPTGHAIDVEARPDVTREALDWLDRYLGRP